MKRKLSPSSGQQPPASASSSATTTATQPGHHPERSRAAGAATLVNGQMQQRNEGMAFSSKDHQPAASRASSYEQRARSNSITGVATSSSSPSPFLANGGRSSSFASSSTSASNIPTTRGGGGMGAASSGSSSAAAAAMGQSVIAPGLNHSFAPPSMPSSTSSTSSSSSSTATSTMVSQSSSSAKVPAGPAGVEHSPKMRRITVPKDAMQLSSSSPSLPTYHQHLPRSSPGAGAGGGGSGTTSSTTSSSSSAASAAHKHKLQQQQQQQRQQQQQQLHGTLNHTSSSSSYGQNLGGGGGGGQHSASAVVPPPPPAPAGGGLAFATKTTAAPSTASGGVVHHGSSAPKMVKAASLPALTSTGAGSTVSVSSASSHAQSATPVAGGAGAPSSALRTSTGGVAAAVAPPPPPQPPQPQMIHTMMPFAVGAHPQFVLQHPHQIPMQQLTLLHPMHHGHSSSKKSLHALQPILPRPSFGLVNMNMPVLPASKSFGQLPPGVAMTNLSMTSATSGAGTTGSNASSPSLSTIASSPSMLSSSTPATPAMSSPATTTSPTGQQTQQLTGAPSPLPPQPSASAKHSANTRHQAANANGGATSMSLSRSTSGMMSSSSPPLVSASSPPLVSMQASTNGSPPPPPPPPPPMMILSHPLSGLNRNVQLAPKYLPILPLHGPGSFSSTKSTPMSLSATHMQLMNGATSSGAVSSVASSGSSPLMLAPGIRATSTAEAKMIASAASAAAAAGTSTVASSGHSQPTMTEHRQANGGSGSYHNGRQTSPPPSPAGRKVKPSLVPILKLRIGEWERTANFLGEICAKFYYSKRKIVWEIMALGLMAKIELVFSDMTSLEFYMPLDGPSVLTVKVQNSPKFFGEVNPRPGRNIQWAEAEDFTGGLASNLGTHVLTFPKGALVKHYEKLLTIDARMREIVKLVSSVQDSQAQSAMLQSPLLQSPSLCNSMPSPSLKLSTDSASNFLCKSCNCASSYHAAGTSSAFGDASASLTSPLKTSSSAMLTLSPASSSHPASTMSSAGALTSPLRTSSSAMVTLSSASTPSPPTHDPSTVHFDGQSLHDLHNHHHHHHEQHHQQQHNHYHQHQHSTTDANDTDMQSVLSHELASQLLSFDGSSCSATTGMEGLYPLPLLFSSLSSSSSHGVSPMATDPPSFSTASSPSPSTSHSLSASSPSPLSPSSPFGMMMMTDTMTASSSSSPLHLAGPPSPEMDIPSRVMLDLPDTLMAFDLESLSSSLMSSDST